MTATIVVSISEFLSCIGCALLLGFIVGFIVAPVGTQDDDL